MSHTCTPGPDGSISFSMSCCACMDVGQAAVDATDSDPQGWSANEEDVEDEDFFVPVGIEWPEDVITGRPDHYIINGDPSSCDCPEHQALQNPEG